MMHFKNRNSDISGFTLVEVAMTSLIIGLLITSIFSFQYTIFSNISRYARSFRSILLLENMALNIAFERSKEQKKITKKKEKEFGITLEYAQNKIKPNSALKNFKNIVQDQFSAQWKTFGFTQDQKIIKFRYVQPEKKK